MNIKYVHKKPTVEEYNYLIDSVGWDTWDNKIVEEALKNTLSAICVYDENEIIGMGRIIGDKTIFLYLQSIVVHPKYQGRKIGTGIIEELLKQIDEYKKINPDIRTYLGAAKDKEKFYEKFGFIARPNEYMGAGMVLLKK